VSGWKGVVALACVLAIVGGPSVNVAAPARSDAPDELHASRPHGRLLDELRPGAAITGADGNVTFLTARPGRPFGPAGGGRPVAAARGFVDSYGSLFGIGGGSALSTSGVSRGAGGSAVRFQQRVSGVPVLGGELYVHVGRGGGVVAANGETLGEEVTGVEPRVSSRAAAAAAARATSKSERVEASSLTTSAPELWIYAPHLLGPATDAPPRLVWKIEVTSEEGAPVADSVLVDAQRRSIALRWSEIEAATDRGICDANGSYAHVPCAAPFARAEGAPATGIAEVDVAYDNTGAALEFFAEKLGRDGIDDAGLPARATVRYCAPDECPFENAYWDGDQVVYGSGWALADDVVAHELAHGITDYTSRLFYYYQSGAINESMSDVFGELSDLSNDLGTDTPGVRWLVGEDLPFGTLRNMSNPAVYGEPDRMTSPRYAPHAGDYGSVHTNSGVGNKAATLVVDGGSFNGYSMRGVGIDKAARIYYEVAARWLTSGSDYEDLYYALPAACLSISGAYGITADDCEQVRRAVAATELNLQPITGGAAPEAPVCPAGHTRRDVFFDDIEGDPTSSWTSGKINGAANGWYVPQLPYPGSFDPTYATSGTHNLYGDDYPASSDSFVATTRAITVPANAYLRFDHAYGFENDGARNFDGGVVELSVDGGATWTDAGPLFDANGYGGNVTAPDNALAGRAAFVGDSHGYYSSRVNLAPLAGRDVKLRFRLATDESGYSYGWYLDDVRVYQCSAASTSPPPSTPPAPSPSPTTARPPVPLPSVTPPVTLPTALPTSTLPAPLPTPSPPVDELDSTPPVNPSLSSRSHATRAWSSDATAEVLLGEPHDASGVEGLSWDWSHDEGGPDRVVDSQAVASVTSPPLADGSWYFRLRTRDGAGNWSEPTMLGPFWIDTTSPSRPDPSDGLPVFARSIPTLTWGAATDASSGVAGYAVESSAASYDSPSMAALRGAGALGPSDLSVRLEARPGFTYCYRVVAADTAGNKSTGESSCTAFPIDDSELVPDRPRAWSSVGKPGAYFDELGTRTSTRGAKLRRPGIAHARRLALLVATCKSCGRVRLSWNGSPLVPQGAKSAVMDLAARRPGTRLYSFPELAAAEDGTVVIESMSGRPVTILGLGVSKV
jgi:bacillolysin